MQHHASDTPPPSELVNYILACDTRSRVEVAKLFKQLLWAHGSVRRGIQSSAASSPEGLTPLVAQCSAGGSDSEGCTNALGVIFLLAAHINPEERAASGGSDGTSNLYTGLDALTYFRTATHFLSTYTKWMTIDPTTAGGAPSGDDGSSSTSSSSSSSSSTSNRSTAEASNASKLNALFASIVREVGALACSLKLEALAVSPLRRAIACAQRGQKVLTPAHTQLIRVCLKSRQLSIAKQILDDPIFGINPEHTGLETKDFLLYFYYGGLAYAALKDFDRAAEFFIQCINMPSESDAVSSIAVEAFKRLCIVQLFLSRGPQHGPSVWKRRSTPRGAASSLEIAAPVYVKLAKQLIACFEGKDAVAERRVNQMVLDNHEKFVADNMLGLVKQAISLITRERIRRLTSTYLTLSLGGLILFVCFCAFLTFI